MLDKKKTMTCDQAKKLNIESFLADLGYFPISQSVNRMKYKSPFKAEQKTPSFILDTNKNIWIDFAVPSTNGDKLGGTIIDLGTRIFNCSISEFLEKLEKMDTVNFFPIQQKNINTNSKDSKIIINKAIEIINPELISYLSSRDIDLEIARKYCYEIHFSMNSKDYYAVGFKNIKSGWELRNKHFKGSSSPKDITLQRNNATILVCFEGFMDFLSFHGSVLDEKEHYDFLILNTLAFLEKSKPIMIEYRKVILLFDQDNAGTAAASAVMGMGLSMCIDKSTTYKGIAKDVNEYVSKLKWEQSQNSDQDNLNSPEGRKQLGPGM